MENNKYGPSLHERILRFPMRFEEGASLKFNTIRQDKEYSDLKIEISKLKNSSIKRLYRKELEKSFQNNYRGAEI